MDIKYALMGGIHGLVKIVLYANGKRIFFVLENDDNYGWPS